MRVFGFRLPFFVAVVWVGIGSTVWALGHRGYPVETVYTTAVPTSYVVSSSWVQPTSYVVPTYYSTAYWSDPVAVVQPSYVSTAYVRRGLFGRRWLVERPVYTSYAMSSYYPTSYVYPSSYYYPTTYYPTSYYYPTTYYPTSYYYPTTYYRTSTYVPTVLTSATVWPTRYVASSDCGYPEVVVSAPPGRTVSPGVAAPRGNVGSQGGESSTADQGAVDSSVGPNPRELSPVTPQNPPTGGDNTPRTPVAPREQTPPAAMPPNRPGEAGGGQANGGANTQNRQAPGANAQGQGATQKAQTKGAAESKGNVNPQTPANPPENLAPTMPPVAPDGGRVTLPAEPPGESRYEARRPVLPTQAIRPEYPNVLQGFVQARTDGRREEGVRVSVTDRYDPGRGKDTMTDAFGRFAVRLADGEWTVNVTMPSGRVYAVHEVRVSNGQVTDAEGNRIPRLEITR